MVFRNKKLSCNHSCFLSSFLCGNKQESCTKPGRFVFSNNTNDKKIKPYFSPNTLRLFYFPYRKRQLQDMSSHIPHRALCLKLRDGKKHTHTKQLKNRRKKGSNDIGNHCHHLEMVGRHWDKEKPFIIIKQGIIQVKTSKIENVTCKSTQKIYLSLIFKKF